MNAYVITILVSLVIIAIGARLMNRRMSSRIAKLAAKRQQIAQERETNFNKLAELRQRIAELPAEPRAEAPAQPPPNEEGPHENQPVKATQAEHADTRQLEDDLSATWTVGNVWRHMELLEIPRVLGDPVVKYYALGRPTRKDVMMSQVQDAMIRNRVHPQETTTLRSLPAHLPLTPKQARELKERLAKEGEQRTKR